MALFRPFTQDPALLTVFCLSFMVLFASLFLVLRHQGSASAKTRIEALHQAVQGVEAAQYQLSGALGQLTDHSLRNHNQMMQITSLRLEEITQQINETLTHSSVATSRSLGQLHERLNTIDKAQENIEKLSGNVLSLQDILSNKQARGAFGEIQLRDLVTDIMPAHSCRFQETLSNGKRVDCMVMMPLPPGSLCIDSKFPLEAYRKLLDASSGRDRKEASREFRTAVLGHAREIAEKYILAGETADSALMFLPSEAIYAEIHGQHPDIIRECFSMRVWIVSPTTLAATLNTLRAVLQDYRMRAQASIIRRETALLYADIRRLKERIGHFSVHTAQIQKDIPEILISAGKAEKRAARLESFDFEGDVGLETSQESSLQG